VNILGVETSCDETAAAVVADGRRILSNIVASQAHIHAPYGGVFPELASRQHMLWILPVIEDALKGAGLDWKEIEALAVTNGPGLAGSLLVGVNTAKALALAWGLPLVGINHLEGHIYANWLEADPRFPLLCLIVSGGHSDLVLMEGHHCYRMLGRTVDDAAGEAFDKVARLLDLGYPGGPAIQKAAEGGNPTTFDLPRAWLPGSYDFSFSGLKTAVLRLVADYRTRAKQPPITDLAASFQAAVVDVLVEKTRRAAEEYDVQQILLAGGVAANALLRERMASAAERPVLYPSPALCTDNAAMVASAAYFRYRDGLRAGWNLDVVPNLALEEEGAKS